ncbi:GDSL esterase/lipase At5g45670 [Linum perenne]
MAANIMRFTITKLCYCVLLLQCYLNIVTNAQEVPCYFIFGDSLVDNGNNNYITTLARADYPPYGVDFSSGPTGSGEEVLKGVNYASAAAGIREETGKQLGGRISFAGQVKNYKNTVSQIVSLLGDEDSAAKHLRKCIFWVGMGSNDYLNNYFMPMFYNTGNQFTPKQFADDLIERYTEQLKIMYKYGARKFALNAVGQIGCSPSQLAGNSLNGKTCVKTVNSAIQIFNNKLRSRVDRLNDKTPDAKLTFINIYGIFKELMTNPEDHGFSVKNEACCGVGRNKGQFTCLPFQIPCQDRNEYLFWDAFHPTEAVNEFVGKRSYNAKSSSDAHPYDIRHLARL